MLRAGALTLGAALLPKPARPVTAAPTSQATALGTRGVWQPPSGLRQEPIWPEGAPDMAGMPARAERTEVKPTPEAIGGSTSAGVWDVTVPTMTVFPPRGPSRRAAVLVFPGGGFQMLAITIEGTEICDWLVQRGITCVLVKYRVPKSNDYWDRDLGRQVTPKVLRALQDAQRSIRLVRSRAARLGVDPGRIGVMGFSAGGYLVAQTSTILAPAYTPVDAIDRVSSRPDFAVALYPGHLCRGGATLDPGIRVTAHTPPTFIAQAWDDPVDPVCNSLLYARALNVAGVPTELHLFANGGHAFGLRRPGAVAVWPRLVEAWLNETGVR